MTIAPPRIEKTPDGQVTILTDRQRDEIRRALDGQKVAARQYQSAMLADACRFRRLRWSRQTGKSYSMALDDVLLAGSTGHNVMQLSASADLTKELMLKTAEHAEVVAGVAGEMQRAILDGSLDELLYVDEYQVKITQTTVTLPGGERIIGRPANPRTARGFTAHVTLDEFAMHKDSDEIWAAVFPSISSNDRLRLKVASTPKGKKGRFYQICQADDTSHGGVWSDHTVTIFDAVAQGLQVNPAELQAGLDDEEKWNQEYLCLFVDEATAFLTYDLIRSCEHAGLKVVTRIRGVENQPDDEMLVQLELKRLLDLDSFNPKRGELFLGVDVGRRRDLTAFWLMQMIGGVLTPIAVIELHNVPFRHQQTLGERIMGELGVRRACIDETGIGMMLAENLTHKFGQHKCEGVYFTEASKARMAEQMRPRFVDRKLLIPVDNRIREDLHGITKLETAGGHVRYLGEKSGSKGAIHPDHFWGLALCVNAAEAAPVHQLDASNVVTVERSDVERGTLV